MPSLSIASDTSPDEISSISAPSAVKMERIRSSIPSIVGDIPEEDESEHNEEGDQYGADSPVSVDIPHWQEKQILSGQSIPHEGSDSHENLHRATPPNFFIPSGSETSMAENEHAGVRESPDTKEKFFKPLEVHIKDFFRQYCKIYMRRHL